MCVYVYESYGLFKNARGKWERNYVYRLSFSLLFLFNSCETTIIIVFVIFLMLTFPYFGKNIK